MRDMPDGLDPILWYPQILTLIMIGMGMDHRVDDDQKRYIETTPNDRFYTTSFQANASYSIIRV